MCLASFFKKRASAGLVFEKVSIGIVFKVSRLVACFKKVYLCEGINLPSTITSVIFTVFIRALGIPPRELDLPRYGDGGCVRSLNVAENVLRTYNQGNRNM